MHLCQRVFFFGLSPHSHLVAAQDVGDHPPITPIAFAASSAACGGEAPFALYQLVCRHFLATVSPPATFRETKVATIPSLGEIAGRMLWPKPSFVVENVSGWSLIDTDKKHIYDILIKQEEKPCDQQSQLQTDTHKLACRKM